MKEDLITIFTQYKHKLNKIEKKSKSVQRDFINTIFTNEQRKNIVDFISKMHPGYYQNENMLDVSQVRYGIFDC